jgi:hypothetical protein
MTTPGDEMHEGMADATAAASALSALGHHALCYEAERVAGRSSATGLGQQTVAKSRSQGAVSARLETATEAGQADLARGDADGAFIDGWAIPRIQWLTPPYCVDFRPLSRNSE